MGETNSERKNFHGLIDDFRTTMLVTTLANRIHARPMAVVEVGEDGSVLLVTSVDTVKVGEIESNPDVMLTFQSTSKFAALNGQAEVIDDRALVEEHWSEAWRTWFPKGKDDPSIRLIKVHAADGEYWDNAGTNAVKYAFEAAKAYLSGTTPTADKSQHGKVQL